MFNTCLLVIKIFHSHIRVADKRGEKKIVNTLNSLIEIEQGIKKALKKMPTSQGIKKALKKMPTSYSDGKYPLGTSTE